MNGPHLIDNLVMECIMCWKRAETELTHCAGEVWVISDADE